jgi:hypothetical protein
MWVVKVNDGICRFSTIEEAMDYIYRQGISCAEVFKEGSDVFFSGDNSSQCLCDYYSFAVPDGNDLPDNEGGNR